MRNTLTRSTGAKAPSDSSSLDSIRAQMAYTLIGRTVDLLADASTVAHGVVTGVLADKTGTRLLVGGSSYSLNQVLTVTPASLN